MTETANDTTRKILDYLAITGAMAFRNNIRPIPNRKAPKNHKGSGDVIACVNGFYLEVEVKHGDDVMSQDQIDHRAKVLSSGGSYFTVKDFTDFETQFKQTFHSRTRFGK